MSKLNSKIKKIVAENMRSAIISASREIIQNDGLDALTMEKLAHEAEVSTGSIYNYFKNKEAIVGAIMEDAFMNMLNSVSAIASENTSPEKKLLCIVEFMLEDFRSTHYLHKAIMHTRPPTPKEEFSRKHCMLLDTIGGIMSSGAKDGVFKTVDPRLNASALLGMIREFQFSPSRLFENVPSKELARKISSIFLDGIKIKE